MLGTIQAQFNNMQVVYLCFVVHDNELFDMCIHIHTHKHTHGNGEKCMAVSEARLFEQQLFEEY